MSWSIQKIGRPSKVAQMVKEELAKIKCVEPEETIKNKVVEIVQDALSVFPEAMAVEVKANGSQYSPDTTGKAINSLSITINPIYGFVE